MKQVLIILLFSLSCFVSFAQEGRLKYVGIEGGANYIYGDMQSQSFIRQTFSQHGEGVYGEYVKSYAGVKFEIMSKNVRSGLLVGVRFSHVNSTVGLRPSLWNGWGDEYLYVRQASVGQTVEYFRVSQIIKKADYVGIPIEWRYTLTRRQVIFRPFVKLGAEVNYLLKEQIDFEFENHNMEIYEDDIDLGNEKLDPFAAALYAGIGFRIGKELGTSVSVELNFPYFLLTQEKAILIDPIWGGGIQVNVQIPIFLPQKN